MDAIVRNKCEQELLQIVGAIAKELNVQIKIETEAYDEGGLKEFYSFIGTSEGNAIIALAGLVVTMLGILISRIPSKKTKLDKQEQQLSIEEKKLNIEAQKLNIEILKKELERKNIQTIDINIDKVEYIVNNNIKVLKHKSNFYKTLLNYPKVERLSTVKLDESKRQIEKPRIVERKDFGKFILESDNLESITDENASIEIISPVLKKGKYKWRGVYNQIPQAIEFSMKDKEFREDVIKNGIAFKSGTVIDCVIEIARKIDDFGNVFNSNYSVLTVLQQHDEEIVLETPQGRKYRRKKEADQRQTRLFDDEIEL